MPSPDPDDPASARRDSSEADRAEVARNVEAFWDLVARSTDKRLNGRLRGYVPIRTVHERAERWRKK